MVTALRYFFRLERNGGAPPAVYKCEEAVLVVYRKQVTLANIIIFQASAMLTTRAEHPNIISFTENGMCIRLLLLALSFTLVTRRTTTVR